jgi:hypothetical protein
MKLTGMKLIIALDRVTAERLIADLERRMNKEKTVRHSEKTAHHSERAA